MHNMTPHATLECAITRKQLFLHCDLWHDGLRELFEGLRLSRNAEDKVDCIAA
jgi:hypothetical protein